MPRGLMIKRDFSNLTSSAGALSSMHDKSLPLKKKAIKNFEAMIATQNHPLFHPSFLVHNTNSSPESDRPESPEPEVLDLRIKRHPHGYLYAPSLQTLLQVIPSSSPILSTQHIMSSLPDTFIRKHQGNVPKLPSSVPSSPTKKGSNKRKSAPTSSSKSPVKKSKNSLLKKLGFDEYKSSPVSGTFILDSDAEDDDVAANLGIIRRNGDIDPSLNVVIETEEAREELAKIENKIGDYNCCLCRQHFLDAFRLASHRCPRIVHIEYRCTECEKVFNCPANLASHRRWHKPRDSTATVGKKTTTTTTTTPMSDCEEEQSPPGVFIGRNH